MRPENHLFALIKSLSSAEKRYFNLFSQRAGKRKDQLYFRLFTAIDAQDEYDEQALKRQFAGTSFGKNLAFPKSHLYGQVLRSLQAFHYEKADLGRFGSYLEKAELLADRGLPEQALRVVKKRLREALNLELALPVLQLLRWERRLVLRLQENNYSREIDRIAAMELLWERSFAVEQAAVRLHDALYLMVQEVRRKTRARDAGDLLRMRAELEALEAGGDLNFEARIALCRAKAHHAHLTDDFSGVHSAYREEVSTWQAHPQQLRRDAMRYIRTFGAWLNSKTLIRDDANLLNEIRQLRREEGMGQAEQAQIFRITYSLELFYYLNSGQLDKALELAPEIETGLRRYDVFLSPGFKLGFYHNLAVLFWLGERASSAMRWVQAILQFGAGEIRRDIREFAPLLEKILLLERGHLDALESWFRACQYRRRKGDPPGPLEEMLLRLIRGLLGEGPEGDPGSCYRRFLEELAAQAGAPGISRLGLEELRLWAEKKAGN